MRYGVPVSRDVIDDEPRTSSLKKASPSPSRLLASAYSSGM